MDNISLLVFGDICPTKDTQGLFDAGDEMHLFNDVIDDIRKADIVLGNLECAVTDSPKPIQKGGPVLYTRTKSINALRSFSLLSMANNHIRDCGDDGVMTALSTCKQLGIEAIGAGQNIEQARKPAMFEVRGIKVGVMSLAEKEFNAATKERPGAACLDVLEDFDRIRQLRAAVDYLVVLYHGGIEYFPYASPGLMKKCRKFVDCGANLVVCQHSHCIGMKEQYGGGQIIYGQGNSIFGYREHNDSWNRGLLLSVGIHKDEKGCEGTLNVKVIEATPQGIHYLPQQEAEEVLKEVEERSNMPEEQRLEKWDRFCYRHSLIHLPLLLGWPRLLIAINRRTNNLLVKLFYGKRKHNNTHNLMRCDSLREAVENVLEKQNYK